MSSKNRIMEHATCILWKNIFIVVEDGFSISNVEKSCEP